METRHNEMLAPWVIFASVPSTPGRPAFVNGFYFLFMFLYFCPPAPLKAFAIGPWEVIPNLLLLLHFIPVGLDVRDVARGTSASMRNINVLEFLRTWSKSAENASKEAIARR